MTPRDLELERSGWFDGSPPCPMKLTLTLYQVAASPTEMPGYSAVALNHTLSASVPSMAPAPFSPTPSGRFRMAVTYYTSGYGGGGAPPAPLLPTEEAPHPPPPQPLRAPLLRLRATRQGLESSQRTWVLSGDLLLAHSRHTVNICGFTPSGFWR